MANKKAETAEATGAEPFTDEELIAAGMEPIGTGSKATAQTVQQPFSDDQLSEVKSFEDALSLAAQFLTQNGGELLDAIDAFGTGFDLINDKAALVGTPFIIMGWNFYVGDYGNEVVAIRAVTEDGRKIVFNDGSSGICAQVKAFSEKHGVMPITCRKGLRASTYQRKDDDGNLMFAANNQPVMATTHYF